MDDQRLQFTPKKRLRIYRSAELTAFLLCVIILLKIAMKQILKRRIIVRNTNAIFVNHFVDGAIEDLLGLTDSEESSSSSNGAIFESHQPFVLDLHDVVKNEPTSENDHPSSRNKKLKKKKRDPLESKRTESGGSSSTVSESSVPPAGVDAHSKEEFYDAHESYHGLSESQASNPLAVAAILQAVSEHGPAPKLLQPQTTTIRQGSSASRKEPSTISKPAQARQ